MAEYQEAENGREEVFVRQEAEFVQPEKETVRRKKWVAALLVLTGVICLAGAGFYFYERSQSGTAREYDGVLVQERWEMVV